MRFKTKVCKALGQKNKLIGLLHDELAYWKREKRLELSLSNTAMAGVEFFVTQTSEQLELCDNNINLLTKELQNI